MRTTTVINIPNRVTTGAFAAGRRVMGLILAAWLLAPWPVSAQGATTLDEITYANLPGNRVQVQLTLSAPVETSQSTARRGSRWISLT